MYSLAREAKRSKPDAILLANWHEYFSPLWAFNLRMLRRKGIRFGAVIHDPVRDYVLGPAWWHRWSVREAYSFLDSAFTHDVSAPQTFGSKHTFRVVQIPHGPYTVPEGKAERADLRREFGIPEDAKVLLSFGHIRDGKNLDQIIAALPSLPRAYLLVAGREQSLGQKRADYYRNLATGLGVAARCLFHTDYIPNASVWKYFRASDLLMLTYSQDFRSASGVLNVNAQFGLPVLASAGRSPLLDAVAEYGLGTVIEKPDAALIAEAVPRALGVKGDWPRFAGENSWRVNAKRVAQALFE
jgi:glycosyltransferase involved in cell wall biosynthesis